MTSEASTMASPQPGPSAAAAKKRRTFFSSNIVMIPKLAVAPSTSSRPVSAPSHQVLAALLAPEDKAKASASSRPIRERKPRISETAALASGSADDLPRTRPVRAKPPPPATPTSPVMKRARRASAAGQNAPNDSTRLVPPLRRRSLPGQFASPGRSRLNNPLLPPPSPGQQFPLARSRSTPSKSLPTALIKGPKGTKAQNAQTSNERLSALMEKSMRATIGGRDVPYTRVPVFAERANGRRGMRTVITRPAYLTDKPAAPAPTTARQKAKAKADEERLKLEEEQAPLEDVKPVTGKGKGKAKADEKQYLSSGFYCQQPNAKSPNKLVSRIIAQNAFPSRKGKNPLFNALLPKRASRKAGNATAGPSSDRLSFPPLPYDHGYDHFFGKEHEFILPYNIQKQAENGVLNDKKKPAPYQKIRGNVFPDRTRYAVDRAVCNCAPDSDCGENCINRMMSYICGKECPTGERCANKSLTKRTLAPTKVAYTGSRGFGLFATDAIKEGDFVIDYRGEVITLDAFIYRIKNEYAGQKNFYALDYDNGEVIDAGMRGNDARFINHGCSPNLEVRKYQTLGEGYDEFEVGMWAARDIAKDEELFYDYNFSAFGTAKDDLRVPCRCGAPNCVGFLGRRAGEKSAKELALELEAKKAAEAVRSIKKGKKLLRKKIGPKKTIKIVGSLKRAKETLAKKATELGLVRKEAERAMSVDDAVPPTTSPETSAFASETSATSLTDVPGPAEEVPVTLISDIITPITAEPSAGPLTADTSATAASTALPLTPPSDFEFDKEGTPSETDTSTSAQRRKSGWQGWLREIAAEKPRTLEDWHEERIKRRRGTAWMNMMIKEFGCIPSPEAPATEAATEPRKPAGSASSLANSLAAQGFGPGPSGFKNLGGPHNVYRYDKWKKTEDSGTLPGSTSTPAPGADDDINGADEPHALSIGAEAVIGQTKPAGGSAEKRKADETTGVGASIAGPFSASESKKPRISLTFRQLSPTPRSAAAIETEAVLAGGGSLSALDVTLTPSRNETEKKKAIKARNGAPMGWAYVVAPAAADASLGGVGSDLPRSARRGRKSMP